jgi:signal transduction histidine kinase/DNA-binding response OmpR family regulator/ligand-binding sensor domain-containing protein
MLRLFFLLLLCWAAALQAQSPLLETISIEQGLSQGFVPAICQDDDGFLWFATKNGLNRYDGYQFRVFKSDPFDPLSLGDNDIVTVQVSGDFLVLFTHEHRIQLFHRKTQRFYTIQPFAGPYFLNKIFYIDNNSVGVLSWEAGKTALYLIYWPPDLVERIEKGEALKDLLRVEIPLRRPDLLDADLSADQKKIRLLTQDSILEYDIQSDATMAMGLPFPIAKTHQELNGNRIIGDFLGATWVFQDAKLARHKDQKWEVFSLPFSNAYWICTDKKGGFFWFAAGNTLYGIDVNEISFNPKPTWQITSDHQIKSCFADQFGNIWIGTDAHGIRKFSPRTGAFKNYMEGLSIYCQPAYNEKNYVFMGDVRPRTSNMKLLDLRTGEAVNVERLGLPGKEVAREVTAVNGRFWFITNQKPARLTCFDPETGFRESFPLPEAYKAEFPLLRSGPAGEIWVVSQNQIARFDIGSRKFSFFDNPRSAPSEVIAAERSKNGTWWIGTLNGLYKAEPDGNGQVRFSAIKAEKNNRNSLPSNSIKSLLPDPADPNLLWIGTNGHGMSRLDISNNQFTHYTTKNGLPDDVVYGILADDEKPHNLWISTNRGLTRFSPETGLFQYYFKSDGLQDNEFNTFASYKSASGKLFFGGVNGLTVFDPKDLIAHSQPPQVRLTGLKINGVDIGPRDSIALIQTDVAFLERLELPFSQNSIVLQFAATDYTAPQRNQFAYYLEGAEPQWAHRGFEHTAQYLNLAPGTYTFRVKAANSSGVWNEQPTALTIVIYAPWYRTWWAYLMYAGLLALSLFLVYKSQLRRKLEHAEAERLKGLDEFKSRFFTNITHEFRTPLTVILGMTERVLSDGVTQSHPATIAQPLGLIKRSGENLLRLINQILDLAKLESNTLKINYVQDDVLAYLRYIAESLHSLANAQNVMLRVESDQAKIVMDYDPDRLLQIVYNLLSNAIKFTPSGGKVVLRAGLLNLQGLVNLELQVTDTGAGIPPSNLPHIFDRFYQADNLEKAKAGGTGIGLSLTRELIQAMGGTISVDSELGKGTTFIVKLPITNNSKEPEVGSRQWAVGSGQPATTKAWWAAATQGGESPPTAYRLPLTESPSLLLIEDNPDVVEYLAACLGENYQLDFAYNGRAGIEKALEMVPDLIISDVMMPEKDGFEVVETLKNDERSSHIPIVLLTAKATVEDRIAGLRRGADAYLAKPFREEELLVWVEQLIARRRQLQARYARLSTPDTTSEPAAAELALEDSFMQKFRSVLEANFADTEFSVDALCRKLAMSRTQIHRKLSALTNRSTTEHINAFRLEKARELLLAGELNVSEVAFQVGFNDPKYFSRLFAEAFGQTPSELRGKT